MNETLLQNWIQKRKALRRRLAGVMSFNSADLNGGFRLLASEDCGSYVQRSISFKNTEGQVVKGFMLVPKGVRNAPAVIAQGTGRTKELVVGQRGYRWCGLDDIPDSPLQSAHRHGSELAQRGYVVLTMDFDFFGERRGTQIQGLEASAWMQARLDGWRAENQGSDSGVAEGRFQGWMNEFLRTYPELVGFREGLLHGRCTAGRNALEIAQATRILAGLPEVDGKRIGVMGHSSGGINVIWAMALCPELAVGVCSCGLSSYGEILKKRFLHGTNLYVPGILDLIEEMWEVVALIAPRPLWVGNCRDDAGFPIRGTRSTLRKAKEIYTGLKAPRNLRFLVDDAVEHDFTPRLKQDAFLWLDRMLKPDEFSQGGKEIRR